MANTILNQTEPLAIEIANRRCMIRDWVNKTVFSKESRGNSATSCGYLSNSYGSYGQLTNEDVVCVLALTLHMCICMSILYICTIIYIYTTIFIYTHIRIEKEGERERERERELCRMHIDMYLHNSYLQENCGDRYGQIMDRSR